MQAAITSSVTQVTPPKRAALSHIPGDEGWPIVGKTLEVLADPKGQVEKMAATYGLVYRSRVLGETSINMLGPEANELLLFDQAKLFSSAHGWGSILGLLFPRGLMLLDFDEHRLHRRALSVAFKSGPMKSYLAALDAGIAARVAQWRTNPGPILFYPAMKQLTLDLAATSFLGTGIGPEVDEITRAFVDMVAASVAVIRKPWPGTQMARGVRGRARIVAYFSEQIPIRRAKADKERGEDLFSQLCQATHEDGALLSTQDIVDHMSFLMMAAHDTLTSSLTSFVAALAAHPEWQQKLRDEVMALGVRPDEAQRARHRFAWVPFGGGAHMCLGLHFAYMQAKCFARHFLQNLNVSLAPGYVPQWQMWPIPKPKDGLRVTLRPI
jgi:cytochrome P450